MEADMPWGKLDDSFYDHPKLDALGSRRLEGVGLWAVAISWSNRRLTDGHIPSGRVALLGGTLELADALVAAGLFDKAEDGYTIHDFLGFNDSREEVLTRREENAQRQREHRAKSQRDKLRSHSVTNGVSPSTPSRPVPSLPDPSSTRAREIEEARSRQINERMQAQRLQWLAETGKWPDDWGPKPS